LLEDFQHLPSLQNAYIAAGGGALAPSGETRQAHLAGRFAATLLARVSDLLAHPPTIEPVDVLASKLPA
jgi:hypothetical protein